MFHMSIFHWYLNSTLSVGENKSILHFILKSVVQILRRKRECNVISLFLVKTGIISLSLVRDLKKYTLAENMVWN